MIALFTTGQKQQEHIPKEDQVNFLRSFAALGPEINKLTDHFTARLFQSAAVNVQAHVFPVNRFLVDVERFEDDEIEPMAAKGMGRHRNQ